VLHVLFAMLFLGAAFVLNLGLGPVVLALPRSTVAEFFGKFWPGMTRFLHASIGGTALFGIVLYVAGDFHTGTSNAAILLDAGIVLGVLAVIEGEALQIPAVNKPLKNMGQNAVAGGEQASFSPEGSRQIQRVKTTGIIGTLTITLAAILMILAATV
jgi:hypothetical protein